jgi:membrane associated rhomboid family serine protease
MLLPLHTDAHKGQYGIVSILVVAVCLLVHLAVGPNTRKAEEQVAAEVRRVSEQYYDSLETAGDTLQSAYFSVFDSLYATDMSVQEIRVAMGRIGGPDSALVREAAVRVYRSSLAYRFGLVANEFSFINLLTHLFVHGNWMHLVMNMWFFYICGVTMEQHWGSGRFLLGYLLSGVAAALFYLLVARWAAMDINNEPLIGASGAIAGMMGAFVVTHHRAKVKVFYMLGFRARIFDLGAIWYFGFWVLTELFWMLMTLHSGSQIAYAAHVGGFVAGAALGLLLPSAEKAARISGPKSTAYFGAAG